MACMCELMDTLANTATAVSGLLCSSVAIHPQPHSATDGLPKVLRDARSIRGDHVQHPDWKGQGNARGRAGADGSLLGGAT